MENSWHHRLNTALDARKLKWKDLFVYLNGINHITNPSVYAWKPGYGKQSNMMTGDNAALVCSWLRISPMWLFHDKDFC